MSDLTWRTYRDESKAPVPVASSGPVRYRLARKADLEEGPIDVGEHEGGVVVGSGRQLGGGSALPASLLRNETVLIRPKRDYGMSRVLARPQSRPPKATVYRLPRLVAPSVALTPLNPRPGDGKPRYLDAQPLGNGAFKVEAGHVGPAAVEVEDEDVSYTVDYDPAGGVIYVENDGDPVPGDTPIEAVVWQEKTLRHEIEGESTPITDTNGRVLAVAKRRPIDIEDERQLPNFDDETKWSALGQAHYDASPIPQGHKWIVETSAPKEQVREAVRRTLPAGSVWRLEEP